MHNRIGHRFQRRLDVPVWLERGPQGEDTYADKVLGYNPIRYFPLWDPLGSAIAEELVVGDDGTPANVTFGQDGIGDGRTSALFDGATSVVDFVSAAFIAAFDVGEITVSHWVKVFNAGVWTDGTVRFASNLRRDGANTASPFFRIAANGWIRSDYSGGGTNDNITDNALDGNVDWMHVGYTISVAADEMKLYIGGAQLGATQSTLGVWAGALTVAVIGGFDAVPNSAWNGYEAHYSIFDNALAQPAILDLATV